jgi:nitroreductase
MKVTENFHVVCNGKICSFLSNLFFSDEDISLLLEAANWAPTHKRSEPWRYVVIPGPGPIIEYLEFIDTWYADHR